LIERPKGADMKATEIAEKITNGTGYATKVWVGDDRERVYVTRQLSRGRQDMGYVELTPSGVNFGPIVRNRAAIRNAAA